ncbi:MAG: DUF4055 domain-containing protein, partial [Plesiomonas shigelloides]
YEDGAILYNFTRRTLSGMVGAVMRKPPELTLPDALQYMLDNADGDGVGLIQQSQDCLAHVDSVGRAGLLLDSPANAAATMAEQNAGKLNPRILLYTAENIINWHKTQIVLRETYDYQASDFDWRTGEQYRVLELVDGLYQQRLIRFNAEGVAGSEEVFLPNVGGSRLDYIPFVFVGSENNDSSADSIPLETLVDINIGHVRNSADVEESSFICSQPTLMLYPGESMNAQTFHDANPSGIRLGSRSGHNLGAGGASELLQAKESNLAKELMKDKEDQAVMAGAQLITPTAQITAESARLQRGADSSIMATIANNVSAAYERCLTWCAEWLGASGEVVYELNTEFFLLPMTAQDRAQWIADINSGLLPARAYYAAARAAGVTNWSDEEIEEELITA